MGKQEHNVNDNVDLKRNYNVNDNVGESVVRKMVVADICSIRERARDVDRIADHLVRKFQAPGSRNFFCKCAWNLSENDIWTAFEQAHGPKIQNPLKYFIVLCQLKMSH